MTESPADAPWNWKSSSIGYLLMIGINFLFLSMISLSLLLWTGWEFNASGQVVTEGSMLGVWLGTLIAEFLILGITLFLAINIYRGKRRHFNFRRPSNKHLLIAIGGAFAAFGLSFLGGIIQNFITGPDPNQATYDALFQTSTIPLLIVWIALMSFCVAPCEEIFARGFAQKGFHNSCRSKKLSISIGIVIASLLFALLHLDFYRIIPLFFVGLILGLVYYYTNDNSLASTITHGLYNSFGLLLYFFFV